MTTINNEKYNAPLSKSIIKEYNKLITLINTINTPDRYIKDIKGTIKTNISISNIISYQIGYGKLLIYWYKSGIKNKNATIRDIMHKAGHNVWNYTEMALTFYKKYGDKNSTKQLKQFHKTVLSILKFVEKEYTNNNLKKLGIWTWTTLLSGKKWTLEKWVQINTVAPYKRAYTLIRSIYK